MRRSSGYTGSSYYREPTEEEKIHLVKEKFAKGRIDYSQLEQEIDDILNPPKKKGFLK